MPDAFTVCLGNGDHGSQLLSNLLELLGKEHCMEVRAELWLQEFLPSEATVATVAGAHGKAECPHS